MLKPAMYSYIADLRAATQLGLDTKIFRMHRLGIPQDRIAMRLGALQRTPGVSPGYFQRTIVRYTGFTIDG